MTTAHRLGLSFLLSVAALGACSSSGADRVACYARAEAAASARADRECPVGDAGAGAWTECRSRDAILDELAAAFKRCP